LLILFYKEEKTMAFILGNHTIDEILYAVAQDFDDAILYALDQLSGAQIEVSAESQDITDKKGNVVRTKYKSKAGSFSATNAFLHPAVMNTASGSDITEATDAAPIEMPKIEVIPAGGSLTTVGLVEGTVAVVGLYANGANLTGFTQGATADLATKKFGLADGVVTVPAAGTDAPIQYLVKYTRTVTSGIKLSNLSNKFPNSQRLTLQASYVDPCDDNLRPCYIYIPSFMPDPNMTISFDAENQTVDFNGTVQMDYCAADGERVLYYIFYPDEDLVTTVTTSGGDDANQNAGGGDNAGDGN
jgi:hypothetical protein